MNESESLRLLVSVHRDEIHHHEDYISSVLTWTLTISLAMIGSYLAFVATDAWLKHPDWHLLMRICLTVLLVLLTSLTIHAMFSRVDAMNTNARIVVKASTQLGFFEKNNYGQTDALYPETWLHWGEQNHSSTKIIPTYSTSVLLTVAGCGIAIVWLIG